MSTGIYYFSGTGNSLYIAKELQKRIPDSKLIPIISLLDLDTIEIKENSMGIVFPLQGPTFPNAVKIFLQKVNISSTYYVFAVATRGGTTCKIHSQINKILKKKKRQLDAHFILTMFNNDPKHKIDDREYSFRIPSKEELKSKEHELNDKLNHITKIVQHKKVSHNKDTEYTYKYGFLLEQIILLAIKSQENKSIKDYFYTDEKCIGCGICEKVCLSKKISMRNDTPYWHEDIPCHMCYACLNYCPKEAVQIHSKWYMKSYTAEQGRYPHPYATTNDIEKQKRIE